MLGNKTENSLDSASREMLTKALKTGLECLRNGDLANAQSLYEKALQVDPRQDEAWQYLGVIEQQKGNLPRADEYIATAIKINPRNFLYHFNRGVIQQQLGMLDEAVKSYRSSIILKPDYAEAHENLGVALQDTNATREASKSFKKALKYNPDSILAHRNLGTVLEAMGDSKGSLAHFNQVLKRTPAEAETRMKRSMLRLRAGDYGEAWDEYEWRQYAPSFCDQNPARNFPFPKWDGSDPAGRTILIHSEQGLGDEVMFASCLPDLIRACGLCIVECDPRLQAIFKNAFPDAHIIPRRPLSDLTWVNDLPAIDWRLPIAGLPRFFRRKNEEFPKESFYLNGDPQLIAQWGERLAPYNHEMKVGISWRGGRNPRAQRYRSMAIADMAPILKMEGARFISLQYDGDMSERDQLPEALRERLEFLPDIDLFSDLENMAALVKNLDLVISIDNSTVHFAGALGVPTWVLLPSLVDWRWQDNGEKSDWYPSVRIWRKSFSEKNWEPLVRQVAAALEHPESLIRNRGSQPQEHSGNAVTAESVCWKSRETNADTSSTSSCLLLNDTSAWYHWGCSCTSIALHEGIRRQGFSLQSIPHHLTNRLPELPQTLDAFKDRDQFLRWLEKQSHLSEPLHRVETVVINGEGTLHGMAEGALGLLYLAYHAKGTLGKNVQILNHSCYPDGTADPNPSQALELYQEVYSQLDFVGVRETISAALLERLGIKVERTFDCLPLFVRQFFKKTPEKEDYVLVAGSVAWQQQQIPALAKWMKNCRKKGLKVRVLIGAETFMAADDIRFVESLAGFLPQSEWELTMATSESEWLRYIAAARLLVSGRFHHSLAAAWLETPFLLFGSNTPKIPGLMRMLGLEKAFIPFSNDWENVLKCETEGLLVDFGVNLVPKKRRLELERMSEKNFFGLEKISG